MPGLVAGRRSTLRPAAVRFVVVPLIAPASPDATQGLLSHRSAIGGYTAGSDAMCWPTAAATGREVGGLGVSVHLLVLGREPHSRAAADATARPRGAAGLRRQACFAPMVRCAGPRSGRCGAGNRSTAARRRACSTGGRSVGPATGLVRPMTARCRERRETRRLCGRRAPATRLRAGSSRRAPSAERPVRAAAAAVDGRLVRLRRRQCRERRLTPGGAPCSRSIATRSADRHQLDRQELEHTSTPSSWRAARPGVEAEWRSSSPPRSRCRLPTLFICTGNDQDHGFQLSASSS